MLQRTREVTIAILNYNGKSFISETVHSIGELEYPAKKLIMVDDGSTDGSVDFVRENYPGIVKYAIMSIEDKSLFPWDTATEASGAPQPQPAGSQESMVVTGLPTLGDGEIYHFAIRAVDDVGNISDLDTEPPSVVSKPKHVDE